MGGARADKALEEFCPAAPVRLGVSGVAHFSALRSLLYTACLEVGSQVTGLAQKLESGGSRGGCFVAAVGWATPWRFGATGWAPILC